MIWVLSPVSGDKQDPSLNCTRVCDLFGKSKIVAGLMPNETRVTFGRKINGRKWERLKITERGHATMAFVISDPETERHIKQTPKADAIPFHARFVILYGFITGLEFVRIPSHAQRIDNVQDKSSKSISTENKDGNEPQKTFADGSLVELRQMG